MKKLAVIFPGIGYHTDKPLLYYSKRIASNNGFDVKEVPYGNFPEGVKGSKEKMEQAFHIAMEQTEAMLRDVAFEQYDVVLFISKSVGTAVASAYGKKKGLHTQNIFYTPVEASLRFMTDPGIVFHGTKDSWVETELLTRGCEEKGYRVYLTENGNHSLETGDVLPDIKNLNDIMSVTEEYIKAIENK